MKGRPILGVVSGFLFGLLLGPTLWLWGVIALASPLIWILPLVGIVFGLAMAAWAPFGKGSAQEPAPAASIDGLAVGAPPIDQGGAVSQVASEPPPGPRADSGDETRS